MKMNIHRYVHTDRHTYNSDYIQLHERIDDTHGCRSSPACCGKTERHLGCTGLQRPKGGRKSKSVPRMLTMHMCIHYGELHVKGLQGYPDARAPIT